MGKIKNILIGGLLALNALVPYTSKAQENVDKQEAPQNDVTLTVKQNNGYKFFLGPAAGGNTGTQFNLAKGGFFLWGAYDHKNSQMQEVDLGYNMNMLNRESKNKKYSISVAAEPQVWIYPEGSVAGTATDVVMKSYADISAKLFNEKSTTGKLMTVHLLDNNGKSGSAYQLTLDQEMLNKKGWNANAYTTTAFGDGLYGFNGHLNSRIGASISKKFNENLSTVVDAAYQFSGKDQSAIQDIPIVSFTVNYSFKSKK